jgi:hypothetical protein
VNKTISAYIYIYLILLYVNTSFNDPVSSTKTDMNKRKEEKIFQKKTRKQNVNIETKCVREDMYMNKATNEEED